MKDLRAAVRVFYDGGCPICRREIGWYQRRAGADAIDWLDVADYPADVPPDNDTAPLPAGLQREDLLMRFTVQRADGKTARGAAGFIALWRAIPATAWAGRLLDNPVTTAAGEIAYRFFLRVRPLWR
ncbi:MAG: DUF393 domain-containing protein [Pseudomonadota bacterium]